MNIQTLIRNKNKREIINRNHCGFSRVKKAKRTHFTWRPGHDPRMAQNREVQYLTFQGVDIIINGGYPSKMTLIYHKNNQ